MNMSKKRFIKKRDLFYYKSKNQNGFSLVELVIALSLLLIALAGIYNFYFFSNKSSVRAHAESEILQDARIVMMQMEREIRQANRPRNLSNLNLPSGMDINDLPVSKGVELSDSGTKMTIYTYIGSDPVKVSYRITDEGSYSGMERSVDAPHITVPENWDLVLSNIVNSSDYFFIQGKKIYIDIAIMDARGNLSKALNVSNVFTVRGKEAMQ